MVTTGGLRATITKGRTRVGVRQQRAFRRPMTNTDRDSGRCDYTHEEVGCRAVGGRGQGIAEQQH